MTLMISPSYNDNLYSIKWYLGQFLGHGLKVSDDVDGPRPSNYPLTPWFKDWFILDIFKTSKAKYYLFSELRVRIFVSFKYFEFLSGRDKSDRMSHELSC